MRKNLLLLFFVSASILFGSELFLRGLHTFRSAGSPSLKIGEFDPLLGWKLNPKITKGSRIDRSEDGHPVDFYVNSEGYRGDEFAFDPASKRILVLGDSFAQADQVRLEDRFSELLEKSLNERGPGARFDVVNLGISGYSTDQEYLTYLEKGRKIGPRLTLLLFHDNDVWMNGQDHFLDVQKPRLEWRDGGLSVAHYPDPDWTAPRGAAVTGPAAERAALTGLKEFLSRHSMLYSWIRKKVRESPVLTRWCARLGLSGVRLADVPDDFRVWSVHPDERTQAAWELTETILRELNQKILEDGGRLIIVYVPPRPAVHPEHWLATRIRYGFDETGWDVRQVPKRLKAICERLNVQMVDPTGDLARAAKNGGRMYFAIDSHWTRGAHAVVTDVILRDAHDAFV